MFVCEMAEKRERISNVKTTFAKAINQKLIILLTIFLKSTQFARKKELAKTRTIEQSNNSISSPL